MFFRGRASVAVTLLASLFALFCSALAATPADAANCPYSIASVTANQDFTFDPAGSCGTTAGSTIEFPDGMDNNNGNKNTAQGNVRFGSGNTQFIYKAGVNGVAPDTFTLLVTLGPGAGTTIDVTVQSIVGPPILSPFTASSVGYNSSGNSINVATGGNVQRSPTSYSVSATAGGTYGSSATLGTGGSVSINSAGVATFAPTTGYRGNLVFYVKASNVSGDSSATAVTVPVGNPTLSATLTGSGAQGAALSGVSVVGSGGKSPYTCATSVATGALPGGTAIGSNCAITGTPASAGSYNFTVNITDSSTGTGPFTQASPPLTLVISAPAPVASAFTYGSLVAYNAGAAGATSIDLSGHATNSPTNYAVGSATTAQGGSVSVNAAGLASYTPPVGYRGNDSFTFTASNPGGTSSPATVTVTIGDPVFTTSLSSSSGTQGAALSGVAINVSGGKMPYSCATSIASGALPSGVSINADCSITGTPSGSGTFNFTVNVTDSTTGTGPFTQASSALTLNIASATPTVTSISPTSGPASGGTTVTLTGTNFTAATAVTFGATAAVGYTVVNATTITATAPAGTSVVDVRVTTNYGTSATSAADQFTYVEAPTVTSISPTAGPAGGGTTVTLTGTNFTGVTAVTFGATAATGFTYNSSTSITATAPAGVGTVDIRVTTPGGVSAISPADEFTYVPAPTVTSISPTVGPLGGGTTVILTGTNFSGATAVTFGGTAATGYVVDSTTQITATAPAGTGAVNIRVTTAGGTSATGAGNLYTYLAAPTVSGASPSAGPLAGGTSVVITGTNFTSASSVTFDGAAVSYVVNSATQITATAPAHAAGAVDIVITGPGGSGTGTNAYAYVAAPSVSSVSPTGGPSSGGTTVLITGADLSGATAVTFGGVSAAGYTVNSATQITATAPAGSGTVDITVTTAGGTSATSAGDQFTYVQPPTVTSISPTAGPLAGGTTVTITGTDFANASAVTFGATAATGYTVVSDTTITATAPAGSAGTIDIRVTAVGGTSATSAADQFTYLAAPSISGIAPASGPTAGGASVVITGSNFTSATSVTFDGQAASYVINSATQITATTPAHAAGAVDVVVTTPGGSGTSAGGYTFVVAPTVASLSPDQGSSSGGTSTIITGTGFTAATAVTFGGVAATGFTVNSDTQITATTPAHAGGAATVAVTAVGGTGSLASGFTFVAAPTVTSASPVSGPLAGGATVTITGTDFSGATAVTFGGVAATGFTVVSATTITAIAPAHAAGAVALSVTTVGGTGTLASGYTYVAVPTISGLSPTSGPSGGGASVVITGTDFTGATAVTFDGVAASYVVNSATQITATTPAHAAGAVDVAVTAPGGAATAVGAFTYVTAPSVTSLSPTSGPVAGGTTVIVTGSGFTGATAVKFGATNATGYVVDSATQITATAPAGSAGATNVTVTTVGGTSATGAGNAYTYAPVPTVSGVSPTAGPLAGGNSVIITGSGFGNATSVTFGGVAATGYTIDSATQITATAPAGAAGSVDVAVTTAGGSGTLVGGYRYAQVAAVTAISPTAGPATGGATVILTGSGFTGATGVTFGATAATGYVINSDTQITATSPAGSAGAVNITVTAPGGSSATGAANSYTYVAAPTVTGLSPSFGPVGGGATIIVTGTGFTGATAVKFGATNATGFTVDSATQITATSPAGAGTTNVTVTTAGGASATGAANAFTFGDGPAVTGLSPAAGPEGGSNSVVLTGANLTGASAVRFGAVAATGFSVDSATQITAIAPAGTGSVNVTVTTSVGTSLTAAGNLYAYTPTPTVTAVSPSVAASAGGASVVITGTNLTGASAVTFGATNATSYTVNSATQITATAPAGTGVVNIRVTTPGGTSATASGNQFTYADVPAISGLSPSSGPTSGGTSVVITGTAFTGATGVAFGGAAATSYTVDSATQITATSPAGPAGTINVTVTTVGGTSAGASFTYLDPVTVTGAASDGELGKTYSVTYTAAGGRAPYAFSVSAGALPPGLSLSATGVLSGAPTAAGAYAFTVQATDADAVVGSLAQSVTIAGSPLVLSGGGGNVPAEANFSTTFSASGGVAPYKYALSGSLPAGLNFDEATGTVSGVTSAVGSYSFTVSVTDSAATPTTVSSSFTLVVTPLAPPAVEPIVVIPPVPGEPVTIDLSDRIDGAYDDVYIVRPPSFGTVTIRREGGAIAAQSSSSSRGARSSAMAAAAEATSFSIVYTPNPGYTGGDTFTYAARGPGGESPPARVVIGEVPAPVAVTDAAIASSGKATTITVTTNDTGAFDSLAIAAAPTYGVAEVSGLSIIYTSKAGFSGLDTFTYTVTGPGGTSAAAEVRVTVNPQVSTAPPVTVTILQGQQAVVDLTNGATGGPFTGATVTSLAPTTAGTNAISSPSAGRYSLTFTPEAAFSGQATIQYTLSNATSTSAPGTVIVNVTPRPDPTLDPEVRGLIAAQGASARRFANAQIGNFNRRLEQLHNGGGVGGANGIGIQGGVTDRMDGVEARERMRRRAAYGAYESEEDRMRDLGRDVGALRQPAQAQTLAALHEGRGAGGGAGEIGSDGKPKRWGVWAAGNADFGMREAITGQKGFRFTTDGLTFGADYRVNPRLAVGLGVGYGRDVTKVGHGGTKSRADSFSGGLYASFQPMEGGFIDGVIGYGGLNFDSRRLVTATGEIVTGERDGDQLFAALTAGVEHRRGALMISPYGRIGITRSWLDPYTEVGGGVYGLSYDGQTLRSLTGTLGLRANYSQQVSVGQLSPRVRLEYSHDFEGADKAGVRYADWAKSPTYRLAVDSMDRNQARIELGVDLRLNSGLNIGLDLDNTLSSNDETHGLRLTIQSPFE